MLLPDELDTAKKTARQIENSADVWVKEPPSFRNVFSQKKVYLYRSTPHLLNTFGRNIITV